MKLDDEPEIRFRVLGPLRVERDGIGFDLTEMQRKLMLRLLIDRNSVVSRDRLIEALWPGAEGDKSGALGFHISNLRAAVENAETDLIQTESTGYRLRAADDQVDASEFIGLIQEAASLSGSNPSAALERLDRGLGAWAGSAFSDAYYEDWAQHEISRLEEARLWGQELRAKALLEMGRPEEAAVGLAAVVEDHPKNERLRGLQMIALYRSGRQEEALQAYKEARELLGEEWGVEPSPELASIEEKIVLGQDESLRGPSKQETQIHGVPSPSRRLIGRREELEELVELTNSSSVVSLTGVGGVGKTRLAQALALTPGQSFENIWWVSLTSSRDIEQARAAIAEIVGASDGEFGSLVSAIGQRPALLILDNVEHLVGPGLSELIASLRANCPSLTQLATSRRRLNVTGEVIQEIPRLETRPETDGPVASEAAEFFSKIADEQGRRLEEDQLGHVDSIVTRLEGIPLAIEMAVSRLAVLSAAELDARLGDGLDVLGSASTDELEHRRTITSSLEWSVGLLSEKSRTLFRRMGVFAEAASLEAIERICTGGGLEPESLVPALEEMVEASLVARTQAAGTRYVMPPSVQDLATAHLQSSAEEDHVRSRHAGYFRELVVDVAQELVEFSSIEPFDRVEADLSNVVSALRFLTPAHGQEANEVGFGLGAFLVSRGRLSEALDLLTDLRRMSFEPSPETAGLLGILSKLDLLIGETESSERLMKKQAAIGEQIGDFISVANSRFVASCIAWARGELGEAVIAAEAVLNELGPRSHPMAVPILREQGRRRFQLGDFEVLKTVESHLSWWSDQGHPLAGAALSELNGSAAFYVGNLPEADRYLEASAHIYREVGAKIELAQVLGVASSTALAGRRQSRSEKLAYEAWEIGHQEGAAAIESLSLALWGNALRASTRPDSARKRLVKAVQIAMEAPAKVELVWAVSFLASYRALVEEFEPAVVLYKAAEQAGLEMGLAAPVSFERYRDRELRRLREELGEDRYRDLSSLGAGLGPTADLLEHV